MAGRTTAGGRRDKAEPPTRTVEIRVVPRSSREKVDQERAGRIVVRTSAAPVDGAANERVIELLAEFYGVRRRQIELVSGHRSRDKTVRITDTTT